MYSLEWNEMVYWFESEEAFKKAFKDGGKDLLRESSLAFNNYTREIVKCRYDLKEIIDSWMYKRSHEDKMRKLLVVA